MSNDGIEVLISELRERNKWRRGIGKYEDIGAESPISAKQLGITIDNIVNELKKISDFRDWLDEEIKSAEEELSGRSSYGDGYDKGELIGLLSVRAYFTGEEVL